MEIWYFMIIIVLTLPHFLASLRIRIIHLPFIWCWFLMNSKLSFIYHLTSSAAWPVWLSRWFQNHKTVTNPLIKPFISHPIMFPFQINLILNPFATCISTFSLMRYFTMADMILQGTWLIVCKKMIMILGLWCELKN
jgi:hypothetical protein